MFLWTKTLMMEKKVSTQDHLKQNHLTISKEEYIDLDQHQLNSS